MSSSPSEPIKARFFVTAKNVTIFATFHEAKVTLNWPRNKDAERHVNTLVRNLEDVLKEGLNEVFVQDQAKRLDWEIEELYRDTDEEKPDDN